MNDFLAIVKNSFKEDDYKCIEYALLFAKEAHGEQLRISGEPYIMHPCRVAETLIGLGMDSPCIIAALLHDVLEDTKVTESTIKLKFGDEILTLVNGVTKLSRIKFVSKEEEQAENIRKLFFAMAKDMRVLLIKLADRLHNMSTLDYLNPEKQIQKARETLDIYAPLAGRLGISNIKCELEDLSMKYLYPTQFKELKESVGAQRDERMSLVNIVANEIEVQLAELKIKGEVRGRQKHIYSIFKKMRAQDKTLEQIYDLVAVRVIVETVRDCYTVLGVIHSIWKPIPGRFKDYIAMPKPNLYQSLHTTVVTNFGKTFEIQIRTYEMNRIAEYGIAAHWKYKEGKTLNAMTDFDSKLGWIKEVMDVQGDLKDSLEFIDALKLDVLNNEIYVFSPKGDVFDIASDATCIDFAYRVHSAVGNKCIGAKVNSRIVPLSQTLQNGDIVEIMTSNGAKGPSRDWLKFIKTPTAKAKIRSFFKKELQVENIKTGKDMLEREAKHRGYQLSDLMVPSLVNIILDRYSFSSIEDMYASVGYGGITTNQILLKLIDFYRKEKAFNAPIIEVSKTDTVPRKNTSGIIIEGFDDFLIRLSHCCTPVPGDEIVGYVSRGRGVSVHRKDCPNMRNVEKERIMSAVWASNNTSVFTVMLRIDCYDKSGLLGTLTALISGLKIPITSVNARITEKEIAIINIGLQIKTISDLELVIKKIENAENVISVCRSQ